MENADDLIKFIEDNSEGKPGDFAHFVTMEKRKSVVDPVDEKIRQQAETGEGLVEVTPEMLKELSELAASASEHFDSVAEKIIDEGRARRIRELKVEKGYSWRALASACYDEWGGDWSPKSNQIMGMAACRVAARFFGEDYMKAPWN